MESKSAPSWKTKPTRRRKSSSAFSFMRETSWPRTWTAPCEGRKRPAASLSARVFPVPVSPSKISVSRSCTENPTPCKISPSAKPMRTSSKVMTGSCWAVCVRVDVLIGSCQDYSGNGRCAELVFSEKLGGGRSENFVGQEQRDFGEERVRDDNHDRSHYYSLRGGSANALCAASYGEALVAADGGENESEDERLHHALHDVRELEDFDGAGPEFDNVEAEGEHGRDATSDQPDEIHQSAEEGRHRDAGENTRRDQFAVRVGAHGAHGVDLLGDLHGT